MASLILLIFILGDISDWFLWLILFYYIVAYRQLFGYSLWGTVWRILVGTFEVIQLLIVVVCLNEIREAILDKIDNSVGNLSTLTVLVLLLGAGTVYVAHRINKRPTPATQK